MQVFQQFLSVQSLFFFFHPFGLLISIVDGFN